MVKCVYIHLEMYTVNTVDVKMLWLLISLVVTTAFALDCPKDQYYVFSPDTADETCFFRVEKKCVDSIQNLPDRELYKSPFDSKNEIYLQNATDQNQPILKGECYKEYLPKLYMSFTEIENGHFYSHFWYPTNSTKIPFDAPLAYVVYENKWIQGLRVQLRDVRPTQGGLFVITGVYPEESIIVKEDQPINTKPFDFKAKWTTADTLLTIGGAGGFIVLLILFVNLCRHSRTDLKR
jgi:hypothetical protein